MRHQLDLRGHALLRLLQHLGQILQDQPTGRIRIPAMELHDIVAESTTNINKQRAAIMDVHILEECLSRIKPRIHPAGPAFPANSHEAIKLLPGSRVRLQVVEEAQLRLISVLERAMLPICRVFVIPLFQMRWKGEDPGGDAIGPIYISNGTICPVKDRLTCTGKSR